MIKIIKFPKSLMGYFLQSTRKNYHKKYPTTLIGFMVTLIIPGGLTISHNSYGILEVLASCFQTEITMNYLSTLLFTMIVLLNNIAFGQEVPDNWTPTMKIQASYGGGMLYYRYEIQITDTISFMRIESNKGIQDYTRKFSAVELNGILHYLFSHHFNRIKSEFIGLTRDKASESVSLSWDHHNIGVSESSSSSIEEAYREDFGLIQSYLEGLFAKEKE